MHVLSVPLLFRCSLIALLLVSASAWAETQSPIPHVIFINPGHLNDNITGPFWPNTCALMEEAAKDLPVKLEIRSANRDRLLMNTLIGQAIAEKPDYLLLVDENQQMSKLLDAIDGSGVKFFFINNAPHKELADGSFSGFLGNMVPNDYEAAVDMLEHIVRESLQPKLQLLALYGDLTSNTGLRREAGLRHVLQRYPNKLELIYADHAFWSDHQGYRLAKAFFRRVGAVDVVWGVNDTSVFGAIRAAQELGITGQQPIQFAGFNWDAVPDYVPESFVSYGGHFTQGAFAVVLLHDHYHGLRKLKKTFTLEVFASSHSDLGRSFKQIMRLGDYASFDYQQFSRTYHHNPLPMTLNALLQSRVAKASSLRPPPAAQSDRAQ